MKDRVTYQNPLLFATRCNTVVLRCIDFRFRPHLEGLLAQLFADESGLGDYDEIAVAGGAKALTDGRLDATIEELKVAIRHHQARRVVLVAHRDCAAFGGTLSFSTTVAEKNAQVAVLRDARTQISKAFLGSNIRVILLFQDKDALEVIE